MNRVALNTLARLAGEMADQGRTVEADALREAVKRLGRQEGLITTGEAAERLGISIPTVRRWCERGALAGVNMGTRWLVYAESVERVLRIRRNLREMDEEGNPTEEELAELYQPRRENVPRGENVA